MASSRAWQNCLSLAHSFLHRNITSGSESTRECLRSDSDPEYMNDPCCNVEYVEFLTPLKLLDYNLQCAANLRLSHSIA